DRSGPIRAREGNLTAKQIGVDPRVIEGRDFVAVVHDQAVGAGIFGGGRTPTPRGRPDAARRSAPSQEQSERRKHGAAVNTAGHSLDIRFSSRLAECSRERLVANLAPV